MKTSMIISAVLIGVSALAFAAKENPAADTKTYDPGKFYGLIVNNNANIILSQGERNSIRIEGDKQAINNVHTEIQNGTLVIGSDDNSIVNIYISVEELNMVEVNGQGKIFGMGTLCSDILLLKVNGSGSMKVDVRTLKVAMIVRGEGKIIVSGSTGESFSRQYGKGKIYNENLFSFSHTEDRITSKIDNETGAAKL